MEKTIWTSLGFALVLSFFIGLILEVNLVSFLCPFKNDVTFKITT